MYKIYMLEYDQVSNTLLEDFPILVYDDENSSPAQKLVSPVLTLEDNRAGSLTFTMPSENAGYEKIKILKSTLVVKRRVINPAPGSENWETIWEGRVISETKDFFNQKSITCEGALAYLNDMYVLKWEGLEQSQTKVMPYNNKSIQFKAIFQYLITAYNPSVNAVQYSSDGINTTVIGKTHDRSIYVNNDDIASYLGNYVLDFSSSYETILDYICNSIIDRHGGHVRIRKRNGRYGDRTGGVSSMDYDYTDENPTALKGLCIEYVQEYYSLDLGAFSSNKTYSIGDHAIYQDKVYRFIKNHIGSFNNNDVEQIQNVKVLGIEFATNLVDLVKEVDGTDWCTAVLMTGDKNERYTDQDMHKIIYTVPDIFPDPIILGLDRWIKGNNSGAASMVDHQLDERIRADYPMDPDFPIAKVPGALRFAWEPTHFYNDIQPFYIVNTRAASEFGIVAKQYSANFGVKKNEDPQPGEYKYNYEECAMLYQIGIEFLKQHSPDRFSVEVTALDMNFIDSDAPYANIGDIFYVNSSTHGFDRSTYFILTKMTIPLDSPESTTFTLNRTVSKKVSQLVV